MINSEIGRKKKLVIKKNSQTPKIFVVDTLVNFKEDGHYLFNSSSNLADGGVFLKTEDDFHVDETVNLIFKLPRLESHIEVQAKVLWVQKTASYTKIFPGIGLEFLEFPLENRKKLLASQKKS